MAQARFGQTQEADPPKFVFESNIHIPISTGYLPRRRPLERSAQIRRRSAALFDLGTGGCCQRKRACAGFAPANVPISGGGHRMLEETQDTARRLNGLSILPVDQELVKVGVSVFGLTVPP